ncbi:hypothetical protein EW145_g8390 [Phellinidium pouzarii]|uniref:Uncharacterized protein n=1 Tax=Phellinidium pouzarii TaxID=167371 RepID=A0A4S4KAU3_9AGAM|nr:hypothetical protein EW145_g8390 [Phellinidium pouzarii]
MVSSDSTVLTASPPSSPPPLPPPPPPPQQTVTLPTRKDASTQVTPPSTGRSSPVPGPPAPPALAAAAPTVVPPENKDVIAIPSRLSPIASLAESTSEASLPPPTPPARAPERKYSIPLPPRAPPPPPSEDPEPRAIPAPPSPVVEVEGKKDANAVEEEAMGEIDGKEEHGQHGQHGQTADDDSSDDENRQSFISARDEIDSIIKPDFPLTSKWSRDTSAVPSAAASVSTLEDSRFPPITSFPPPPPLPVKHAPKSNSLLLERKPFGSSTSLPERGISPGHDGDSLDHPAVKTALTTAIEAALSKNPPGLARSSSLASRGAASPPASEDPDGINRRALAEKMAKLDGFQLPIPTPFPSSENPLAPDMTKARQAEEDTTRKIKLSSKLASLTGMRMTVRPTFGSKMTSSESMPSVFPEIEDEYSADGEEDSTISRSASTATIRKTCISRTSNDDVLFE